MRDYDPTSFVLYYIDDFNRKAIVAGNHRIAAKKYLDSRRTQGDDSPADPRLACIKLSSRIPVLIGLQASSGMCVFIRLFMCVGWSFADYIACLHAQLKTRRTLSLFEHQSSTTSLRASDTFRP